MLEDVEISRGSPALAHDDDVALVHSEAGGHVCWSVAMPLLIPAHALGLSDHEIPGYSLAYALLALVVLPTHSMCQTMRNMHLFMITCCNAKALRATS